MFNHFKERNLETYHELSLLCWRADYFVTVKRGNEFSFYNMVRDNLW